MSSIYAADFETRAGKAALEDNKTYVWAWCLTDIYNREHVITGNRINSFIETISHLGNITVYFHNLKFDGKFIISFLLKIGYKYVTKTEEKKTLCKGEFDCMISEEGVFYAIRINFGYRRTVDIRDSTKKLPGTVKSIGESFKTKAQKLSIDYVEERPEVYKMTAQEEHYIKNDVLVIAEALEHQYNSGLGKMTIGSDCLNEYKAMLGDNYRRLFPELEESIDKDIRRAYKGGWCYLDKPGEYGFDKKITGYTYDVNSLYPFVMHSMSGNKYPFGQPVHFDGEYIDDPIHDIFIQHIKASFIIKDNFLPMVQVKNNPLYKGNEWLKSSYYTDITGGLQLGEVDLYLTGGELDMFFRHYEVLSCEFIDGWKFQSECGFFDEYINKWIEVKKNSTGAIRQIAKLMLNNLGGKFGMRTELCNKEPYLDENGVLKLKRSEAGPSKHHGVYIPVAVFMTSYARQYTITAAQANYENFIYSDTDSIHLLKPGKNITIHDKNLGAWALEKTWNIGIFRRQKTYFEFADGDLTELEELNKNYADYETKCKFDKLITDCIKCAGMPVEAKAKFMRMILSGDKKLSDFNIGLVISGAKLLPKDVPGGVVLVETDFTMKESSMFLDF